MKLVGLMKKRVGLRLLGLKKECWIKLVGLIEKELWIKIVGP